MPLLVVHNMLCLGEYHSITTFEKHSIHRLTANIKTILPLTKNIVVCSIKL